MRGLPLRRVAWLSVVLSGACGGAYATAEPPLENDAGSSIGPDAAVPATSDGSGASDDGAPDVDATAPDGEIGKGEGDAASKPDSATAGLAWTARAFTADNVFGTCTGARYVAPLTKYALYVGVRLCTSRRYKIYLSSTENGTYYEVGDGSGGGEDHCELVNPTFTLGPGGGITSGNCPTCNASYAGTGEVGGSQHGVFTRNDLGQTPTFESRWTGSDYTNHWYECGVTIP